MKKRTSFELKAWTTDEDAVLIEMYNDPSIKIKDISEALNRSSASIAGRVSKLKLKKVTYASIEVPEGNKICRKCGVMKLTTDFFNNKSKTDGLDCWCKTCLKEYENEKLLKKAEKKVEQENALKTHYITSNEGKLFKCTNCKEELDIHKFGIIKKNGRYTKQSKCKICKNKETQTWKYNKIKELGHI